MKALTENWLVCRVCLKQPKEQMHNIFDKNEAVDLTRMILECGGVPIKKYDHYPDRICTMCLKYLRVAYHFRVTCQRSFKHLSSLIAPVVVEKSAAAIVPDDCVDFEGLEDVALKLEPDNDDVGIKQEYSDNEDEIIETYEPMEPLEEDDFEELDEADELIENVPSTSSILSCPVDDMDFMDEVGEQLVTSDEEYTPKNTGAQKKVKKIQPKKVGRPAKVGRPKGSTSDKQTGSATSTRSSTAAAASAARSKANPRKRGPKKAKQTSYICDICGNIYPSQGRLTEHIKLHKGIKPHECEICGHCFAQTQQLARHMNTHTGNRPYKCSYCPAAFADLSTRNKHHRIHTNERPYVCDVCGKAFTYTNTLKFHKMIHTGEKPFVCDLCGKGFQQSYKLRNHRMTHTRRNDKVEFVQDIEVTALTMVYPEENHETGVQILEI